MSKKRRKFSQDFKFKVALEALKNNQTLNEIAKNYDLYPNQISQWKQQLLKDGPEIFSTGQSRAIEDREKKESQSLKFLSKLKVYIMH